MENGRTSLRLIDCVKLRGPTMILKKEPVERDKDIEAKMQRGSIDPMKYLLYDLQRINRPYS